jgi:ATP-dependent 26S proteasome regulatory subunit
MIVTVAVRSLDNLDAALLRPGRLSTHVYLHIPTVTDARHILYTLTRGRMCLGEHCGMRCRAGMRVRLLVFVPRELLRRV